MKQVRRLDLAVRSLRNLAGFTLLALSTSCLDEPAPTSPIPPFQEQPVAAMSVSSTTAAIEYVAVAQDFSNNGTTISLPHPSGLQPGDLLVAQIGTQGTVTVATPPGWTQIRADHTGVESNSYLFWKRVTPSEPATHSFGLSRGSQAAAGLVAYRGVAADADPIGAHAGQHTPSGPQIVAPSVTASAGELLIAVFSGASDRREAGLTFTPPAGMTEHYDVASQASTGSSQNVAVMHSSAPVLEAGATGTRVAVLSAPRSGWGQLLTLRPAASGPPPPPPPPDNAPPVADAGGPYTAAEGSAIGLDGSGSSDPDGDDLTYAWSFGDGNVGTGASPTHTYVDNGEFTVTLTVTDIHGATGQATTTATVTNVAPAVTVAVTPSSASVDQQVSLTGNFSDPGVADGPWAWEVDWGDGGKASGSASSQTSPITASRSYAAPATYQVRLSVTDKDGGKGEATATVVVSPSGDLSEWFTDFSEYTTGQTPNDWSYPYSAGNYSVEELTGATGGKVLVNSPTSTAFEVLRWDALGTRADIELETVARSSGRNESMALMARGMDGVSTFYSSRLDSGSGLWTLARYNGGSSSALATWANPFPIGTWVRHRLRVEGNTLKVKLWRASDPEPAAWTMEATDSNPLPAGFAGVWMRRSGTTNQFDWVRATALGSGDPSDPEPPPPDDPILSWVWSGGQSASGATVKARLTGPSQQVRLRISTDSLFGTYTETGATATEGNHVATFVLTQLAPDTRYHSRVVVGGTPDVGKQAAFRTLPVTGTPHSFTFALGSCQRTDSNRSVFTHIRQTNPLFWLQTGDIHYRNIAVNDIDPFRHAYNSLHDQSNQAALFRSTSIVHVWDDHDGAGGNDTDGTKTGWPAVRAAYRENVPHHFLPAGPTGAIYHSFVVGRVRFIVSDLRSERSPKGQADDQNKTMLGTVQKQYLKNELALAKANGEFIAWVSGVPWIAARSSGADHWAGYDTERREIAAYIDQLGVGGQMFMLSGDMHATAIDSGINNVWGGFPVFHAAPIDQSSSTKGGPYTHGPFTGGSSGEQFGVVTVTDHGGDSIQITFSGRQNGTEIPGANYQFALTLNGGAVTSLPAAELVALVR
jgi:PKD repeat protein